MKTIVLLIFAVPLAIGIINGQSIAFFLVGIWFALILSSLSFRRLDFLQFLIADIEPGNEKAAKLVSLIFAIVMVGIGFII